MDEVQVVEVNEIDQETERVYTFRKLSSQDIFIMFQIISKIGVNEFNQCFGNESVKEMISSFFSKRDEEAEENEKDKPSIEMIGISLTLEAANIVLSNLPKCESSIYQLLSQTSNLSVEEVRNLGFVTFTEMVIEFVKKEEFKGFIKVVSKLFK